MIGTWWRRVVFVIRPTVRGYPDSAERAVSETVQAMSWRERWALTASPPRRDYLRVVGWGPFPLPGERKRMDELNAKYDAMFNEIEREGDT